MEETDCCEKDIVWDASSSSQGGDEDFVLLWERHSQALYNLCLRWMKGRRADAEEAFGNASVTALVKFKQVSGDLRNPQAWLNQVFRNACIDIYRKRKRQGELALLALDEAEAQGALSHAPVPKNPQQRYLERELNGYLRQAIQALPARLREPILLRFFLQISYCDIAARLRITEENVRKRVQQAREILGEHLASYRTGKPIPASEARGSTPPRIEEKTWHQNRSGASALDEIRAGDTPRTILVRLPTGGIRSVLVFAGRQEGGRPTERRLSALERYVAKHPGGWKKRLEMADLLYAIGRWEEAAVQYGTVLAKRHPLLRVGLRLGEVLHRLGRDAAAEAFEHVLPNRGEAARLHLQGWIELCRDRPEESAAAFERAASAEPANPAHGLALAAVHQQRDRTAEALEAYDRVLEIDPGNLPALTASYEALLAAGHEQEASRRVTRALELDPDNFVAAVRRAEMLIRRRLTGEGEVRRLLRHAARLAPHWPDAAAAWAFFHLAQGRRNRAKSESVQYLDSHPAVARAWLLHARILTATGSRPPAAEAVTEALTLDPGDIETYIEACEILRRADQPEEMRRVRSEMLARFPESWRAWKTEAFARLAEREPEGACQAAQRAVELQPRLAAAWLALGTVLLRCGRTGEAVTVLERCRTLAGGDALSVAAHAALRLGEAFHGLAAPELAKEWIHRAAATASELLTTDLTTALALRGKARLYLGDEQGAREDFAALLERHPATPLAAEVKMRLERLQGKAPSLNVGSR